MVKPGTCILGCAVDPKDVHNLQDYITPRLVWFSYRIKFPPIEPTLKTSDVGWGCTIRSAQMFMANCLLIHELGRGILFGFFLDVLHNSVVKISYFQAHCRVDLHQRSLK